MNKITKITDYNTSENIIFTICHGEKWKQISQITLPNFKQYANKIKTDLVCIEPKNSPLRWKIQGTKLLLLERYQRVAFIDIDCLININSPNIFDEHPNNSFYILAWNSKPEDKNSQMKQINSGVFLANKEHLEIFEQKITTPKYEPYQSQMEHELRCQLHQPKLSVEYLDEIWHGFQERQCCFIYHAWLAEDKITSLKKQEKYMHYKLLI